MLPLLVGAVAALIGIGGVMIGRRAEHRLWLRNRRLDAWGQLGAVAMRALWHPSAEAAAVARLMRSAPPIATGLESHARLEEQVRLETETAFAFHEQLAIAGQMVVLLGPPSMASAAQELVERLRVLVSTQPDETGLVPPGYAEEKADLQVLLGRFLDDGRRHLDANGA
mgnify:CR=1 FL=1